MAGTLENKGFAPFSEFKICIPPRAENANSGGGKMDKIEKGYYLAELAECEERDTMYHMANVESAHEIMTEFSAMFPKMELWETERLGQFFTFGMKSKKELESILTAMKCGYENAIAEAEKILLRLSASEA